MRASEAKGGIAIVTKPGTGEILAMANVVTDAETGEVVVGTNNAALTTEYEPGSVMKIVTVAAALERGAVEPEHAVLPAAGRCRSTTPSSARPRTAAR